MIHAATTTVNARRPQWTRGGHSDSLVDTSLSSVARFLTYDNTRQLARLCDRTLIQQST